MPKSASAVFEYFERGCGIAKKLDAPMVNIVAPWARELSTPATEIPAALLYGRSQTRRKVPHRHRARIRHRRTVVLICRAMNQREYPPVAIHKLNKHLMNVHVRDINATMREFVPIGQGVMDFKAIADAVKAIGFTGFLSLEQDGSREDMKETCRRYIRIMKEYLS
jgi:sugar phosphate isomerase/epimerase